MGPGGSGGSGVSPGARIGLLGGSFNPAHEGHRHISLLALKKLRLTEIWWLVSPHNPLKPRRDMAPYAERLATAGAVASHPRLRVSDLEARLSTGYTLDTLDALRRRLPGIGLVWIMGADNLLQIHQWKGWTGIFKRVPIAVFDRPSYSLRALSGQAARRFGKYRLGVGQAGRLSITPPPAWIFFHDRHHPAAATVIRAQPPEGTATRAKTRKGRG